MPSLAPSVKESQQTGVSSIIPRAPPEVTEDLLTERLNLLREELRREFDDKLARICVREFDEKLERIFGLNARVPSELEAFASCQISSAKDQVEEDPIIESLPHNEASIKNLSDILPTFADEESEDTIEVRGDSKKNLLGETDDVSATCRNDTIAASKNSRKLDVDDMQVEEAHLDTLEPTVWESAIFIGLPQLGNGGAILLSCLLLVNIAMQVIISIIIERKFPSDPLEIEGMHTWRHVLGHHHSQVDMFGHSLVSRVCAGVETLTIAQGQFDLIETARAYVGDDWDGPILCTLVLLIWFLIWLQEAERIGNIAKEVWLVPVASQTRVAVSHDRWSLENLHRGRKIFMYIVCLLRLIVACLLLVRGTFWLLYTISVTELVLNAVALQFIFDVDELVYDIFTPKVAKAMLERLDIHTYATKIKGERVHLKSMAALAHLFTVFTITTIVVLVYVSPNALHVRKVLRTSCGGRKNFVVGRHQDLGMLFWARTIAPDREKEDSLNDIHVIEELVRIDGNSSSAKNIDFGEMRILMSKDASEVADDLIPSCHDSKPSDFPAYWETMKDSLHIPELTSCEDVQQFCGHPTVHLVRMLCPATCRCYYSRPSIAISKGCPYWKCQDNAATAGYYDESLSCADAEASSLIANEDWKGYWQSWLAVKQQESRKSAIAFEKEVVDFALKSGCAVLEEYDLHHDLCSEVKDQHSLGTYCPTSCECPNNDYWGCPSQCYEGGDD